MTTAADIVEKILSEIVADPGDHIQEDDGSYLLPIETEYDPGGEELMSEDHEATLAPLLPAGWTVRWTGTGNGSTEDLRVTPPLRLQRKREEV